MTANFANYTNYAKNELALLGKFVELAV